MHSHLPHMSHFNRAPLAAAVLLALGMAPSASQAAVTSACPGQTDQERTSVVLDSAVDNGGSYSYSYTVCNTSTSDYDPVSLLRDWELPFDGVGQDDGFGSNQEILVNNASITNIVTPEGWTWSIEKRDVPNFDTGWDGIIDWQDAASVPPGSEFYFDGQFLDHEYVLHFYTIAFEFQEVIFQSGFEIDEGDFLMGFGFDSPIGPGAAPYQASWLNALPRTGDPQFPLAGGLPNTFSTTPNIPEPGTLGLFAGGIGAAVAMRRRRRKGQSSQ